MVLIACWLLVSPSGSLAPEADIGRAHSGPSLGLTILIYRRVPLPAACAPFLNAPLSNLGLRRTGAKRGLPVGREPHH